MCSAEELSSNDTKLEAYLKLPCADGSIHEIQREYIKTGVEWIEEQLKHQRKTLVHCRAGIGRSGSMVVAYIYATNPTLSYEEAKTNAKKLKPDIYPHNGLKESLEALWPRSGPS